MYRESHKESLLPSRFGYVQLSVYGAAIANSCQHEDKAETDWAQPRETKAEDLD